MKTYRTSEIASRVGVHPNTVRFYEEQGLLPSIPRASNGYRVYHEQHLLQLRFIRVAFRAEILSNNLRNEAIDIVKTVARSDYRIALKKTDAYQHHLKSEMQWAHEAIDLTEQILTGASCVQPSVGPAIGRREAAEQIGVSIDVLRDWERNGLIDIPRKGNRRQYGSPQMNRLKIISLLRQAHYSQMAIRRMMMKLEETPGSTDAIDIASTLNNPGENEDIISVADRYLHSLQGALDDSDEMIKLIGLMEENS